MGQYVSFDGMTWPALSPALTQLRHELRYGAHPNDFAAHVVGIYLELLRTTQSRRNRIVRGIRKASGFDD